MKAPSKVLTGLSVGALCLTLGLGFLGAQVSTEAVKGVVQPSARPSASPSVSKSPPSKALKESKGWLVDPFYTPVEKFREAQNQVRATGCRSYKCNNRNQDLGLFRKTFLEDVRHEGSGLTTSGKFLNWTQEDGFWLDSTTRDGKGKPLKPNNSASSAALKIGQRFKLKGQGNLIWTVEDNAALGNHTVRLYYGRETEDFNSDSVAQMSSMTLELL